MINLVPIILHIMVWLLLFVSSHLILGISTCKYIKLTSTWPPPCVEASSPSNSMTLTSLLCDCEETFSSPCRTWTPTQWLLDWTIESRKGATHKAHCRQWHRQHSVRGDAYSCVTTWRGFVDLTRLMMFPQNINLISVQVSRNLILRIFLW